MGGWQTADFQGDEIRHGEHVPGDRLHDDRRHGMYIGGDDDDDGLMVRMVVTITVNFMCMLLSGDHFVPY